MTANRTNLTFRTFRSYHSMSLILHAVMSVTFFREGEWRYGHAVSFNVYRGILLILNGLGVSRWPCYSGRYKKHSRWYYLLKYRNSHTGMLSNIKKRRRYWLSVIIKKINTKNKNKPSAYIFSIHNSNCEF